MGGGVPAGFHPKAYLYFILNLIRIIPLYHKVKIICNGLPPFVFCHQASSSSPSPTRPTGSPVSLRSGVGNGKRYEDVVASSSALILHDRPPNLPAKSIDEEAKHKQEYEQMVEAAKKRGEPFFFLKNVSR